jgi:DNA-binding transcriptional MerR regulator
MAQPEELLFPALAAEALGVSPATLRRYAQAWEKAFGPLPRAPGGGRLWPRAALARLQAARELAQREGLPLGEALLRVEGEAPLVATARPEEEALALLREALVRLERLEGEVRALREENARLREALRALEPPRRRPWWRFWG